MSASGRLFRALLRLYPGPFRAEFADEMGSFFFGPALRLALLAVFLLFAELFLLTFFFTTGPPCR